MLLPVVQISLIMNVAKVLSSLGQLIIVQLLVYSRDHGDRVLLINNTHDIRLIYAIISGLQKRLTRGLFILVSCDIITV